jgi:heat shock protein beta
VAKLIRRYSEFIDFPIYLNEEKEIEEEVVADKAEETDDDELEVKEKTEEKKEKIKRKVWEWQQINTDKALWLRDKDDIYEEDYIEFYKSISKQSNPPMNWVHFNTEGEIVFTSIVYIPNRAPFDFYNGYNTRKNDIKLYTRRVLLTEKNADLLPKYLSFVMGVVDSNDLNINVAR